MLDDADTIRAVEFAFDFDHFICTLDALKDHAAKRSVITTRTLGVDDWLVGMIFSPPLHVNPVLAPVC